MADVVEGEQVDYALRVRRKKEYGLGDDSDGGCGGDLTSSHQTAIRVLDGHGYSMMPRCAQREVENLQEQFRHAASRRRPTGVYSFAYSSTPA